MLEISIDTSELGDSDKMLDLLSTVARNTVPVEKATLISCLLPIIYLQMSRLETLRTAKPGAFAQGFEDFYEMINDARESLSEDEDIKNFFKNIIKVIEIIESHPRKGMLRIEDGRVIGLFKESI